jgi:hypothetical protein
MQSTKDLARNLLVGGLACAIVGTFVAALAAPHGAVLIGPVYRGGHGDDGNSFFFVVGMAAAWAGYIMITIWTIAQGVALGNRLSRH